MIRIQECADKESKSFNGYLRETTEWMLQAALKEVLDEEESPQDYSKSREKERMRNLNGILRKRWDSPPGFDSPTNRAFSKNFRAGAMCKKRTLMVHLLIT